MDKRREKPFLIKLVCVIASFALWLYVVNIENPSRVERLRNVKVEIVNEELLADRKLVMLPSHEQNLTVDLSLKGPITEIAKVKAEDFKLVVDVKGLVPGKGPNKLWVEVKKVPINIEITNSESLMVTIHLDDLIEKTVPVKADVNVETKEGYAAFEPVVKPTSVLVSGAAQYVNSVDHIVALGSAKDADKDQVMSLPLMAVDAAKRTVNDVKIQTQYADIVVPVKKTKSVSINVKRKGETKDIFVKSLKPVPDKIDIAGDAKTLNDINSLDTEQVDVTGISSNKTVETKLVVPKNVTLVGSNGTVNVEVVVEKIISRNFTLDVKLLNQSNDLVYTMDKPKVSLSVQGLESRINNLTNDDVQCTIDVKDLVERTEEYPLKLNVKLPEGANMVTPPADTIKVLIKKKDNKT